MPKLTAFLGALAPKFGVDVSAHLAALAENDIELPDELAGAFTSKEILTEDSARNNPKLKAHFYAQSLSPMDRTLEALMSEHGFTDEQQQEVKGGQGTYERQKLFTRILAERKPTAQVNDEVTKLHAQLAAERKIAQEKEAAKDAELQKYIHNFTLDTALAKRRLDEEKFGGRDIAADFAKIQLEKALAEKGVIKIYDPVSNNFKLKQASNPEMDFFIDNSPASFDTFLDQLLADKMILKINDQGPAAPPVNPGAIPPNRTPAQRPNNNLASAYDDVLREFEAGSH